MTGTILYCTTNNPRQIYSTSFSVGHQLFVTERSNFQTPADSSSPVNESAVDSCLSVVVNLLMVRSGHPPTIVPRLVETVPTQTPR